MALLVVLLALAPTPAAAHAEPDTTNPLPNASVVEAPDRASITFSEPIDPGTVSVELLDPRLLPIEGVGRPTVDAAGTGVGIGLPPLDPGIYTVSYRVTSTLDGHSTLGRFAFVVDPTGAQAPPALPAVVSSPSVDGWAVAARWVALVGGLVGLGSLSTWWLAGRPVLASRAPGAALRPPWRVIGASAACTALGLVLYLALTARPAAGDGPLGVDLGVLWGSTPFAGAMRLAILSALMAGLTSLVLGWRARGGEQSIAAAAVGGGFAVSLAGMSAAGHAAALGGPINAAIDWLHLVAAAAWLGGLPVVPALARRAPLDPPSRRALAGEILRRHGRAAIVAAPLVVITGLANSPLLLGTSRGLVASEYGNLVLLKALLVSVGLGIGAVSYLLVRGRGHAGVAVLLGAELLVAAVAVMAAAAMVTIQPAAGRQPVVSAPALQPAHFFGEAGGSRVHASVSLPAPGPQDYRVTLRDAADGRPTGDVRSVLLTFTPPPQSSRAAESIELDADPELDGLYVARGAHTPDVGDWGLEVTVRRAGTADADARFEMTVAEPGGARIAPPPDTGIGVPAPLAVLWSVLPPGPAAWIPAAVLIAAVLAVGRWMRRRIALQTGLAAMAIVVVLAAGSRSVVEAASRPTAADLSRFLNAESGSAEEGRRLYLANCASCHGADGQGDGPLRTLPAPRPLAEVLPGMASLEVSYRIATGLAGTPMPAFAASLTDQERLDLVSYLRERWGTP